MKLKKGDVIETTGLVFNDAYDKETGEYIQEKDKKSSRPAVVIANDGESVYLLALTSQLEQYDYHSDKFFRLKKDSNNMLAKTSLINLANIFKLNEYNHINRLVAVIDTYDLNKILEKLNRYQSETMFKNSYYDDIRSQLA